nr:unnamed protein product [Callosobruchus analis]
MFSFCLVFVFVVCLIDYILLHVRHTNK